MFVLYTNELPSVPSGSVQMYADDTTITFELSGLRVVGVLNKKTRNT